MIALPRSGELARQVESFACQQADDADVRTRKAHFTFAMILIIPAGLVWALLYFLFGARLAALLPLSYSVLSTANIAVLRRTRAFRPFQIIQIVLIMALPIGLQLVLGGFVAGSAVIVWALLGPLLAVISTPAREAVIWFGVFVGAVIIAGITQSSIEVASGFPPWLVRGLFVMNICAVSAIALFMLVSFVGARDRLRQLEVAYLEQTVMLRQREKLATLGTLAAGVAHELNNPAAAIQRLAEQLRPALAGVRRSSVELSQQKVLVEQTERLDKRIEPVIPLSTLDIASHEQELEDWLDRHGIDRPWELAPTLVASGWTSADLDVLAAQLDSQTVGAGVSLLAHAATATSLSDGIIIAARRISEIVAALRSYSFLDRGAWQTVDITEGLESTLVLMRGKLRDTRVERDYEPDLPPIEVRGNELNQVWTNVIHNAVDATGGSGRLVIRTFMNDGRVVVELEDDGPGMPPAVAQRVFDPFFTTKPPGSGTGLGLNISHNIVVRQHAGQISVSSEPGRTCFRVELPITHPRDEDADSAGEGRDLDLRL